MTRESELTEIRLFQQGKRIEDLAGSRSTGRTKWFPELSSNHSYSVGKLTMSCTAHQGAESEAEY